MKIHGVSGEDHVSVTWWIDVAYKPIWFEVVSCLFAHPVIGANTIGKSEGNDGIPGYPRSFGIVKYEITRGELVTFS